MTGERVFHVDITLLRLATERGAAMAMRDELARQFTEQYPANRLRIDFPTASFANFDADEIMAGVEIPGWRVQWDRS